jgi:hypothetical protein
LVVRAVRKGNLSALKLLVQFGANLETEGQVTPGCL